jgi:hypothetical protein
MQQTEANLITNAIAEQEINCLTVRQPGPYGDFIDRPHFSCPILTAGLFLLRCWSYDIKIQGGTVHDFLRHCTVEYKRGQRGCNTYHVIYRHDNGQRVDIGGTFAPHKPDLLPLEKLDF